MATPRKFSIADVLGFGASPKRDLTQGYRREVGKIKRGEKLQGSISRARPTASQELGQLLTPNTRFGNELAAKIAEAVDYSPLSFLTGLVDARRAYNAGNVGTAASTGLLAALGAIPGGRGAKVAKEAAETAAKRGIIAYHGSPHSFDKFDLNKIGTGEGAQAYGHGLYFAENENVAKKYRDDLTSRVRRSADRLIASNKTIDDAINDAQSEIDRLMSLPNGGGDIFRRDGLVALKKQAIDELTARKRGAGIGNGSMYQVRINADPNSFIDWDALLNNQGPNVSAVLGKSDQIAAADVLSRALRNKMHAGDLIKSNSATPEELSRGLLDMGIPGIKYLDAGSRSLENPTRNFVVFDDSLIDILKKYGIAIPAIAGGGLLAMQPNQDGGL